MSDNNEKNLQDNEQQPTNEAIEKELEETVEPKSSLDLGKADPGIVTSAVPAAAGAAAPARSSSAVIVPWVIAVIAIAALVFVLIRNTSGGTSNEAIGQLDGYTINKTDFYDEMKDRVGEDQISALVDEIAQTKIIELESEKAGIKINDEDMKNEIENFKKAYGFETDEDMSAALTQAGFTLEDFKEKQIMPTLKIKLLFENKHPVTEEELKTYFEDKKDSTFATTPKEIKASHILVNTKEEAEAVLAELKGGKDFANLAKEKSQDPGSKAEGGDLGFFGRGVMNQRFETAAFALAKGETSEVVEADNGFHIIKITDIKEAVVPEYDTVKADVKKAYYEEKMGTEATTWLETLKKDRNYKNLIAKEPEAASPTASATASPEASPSAQ
ncbi:peptidylprolyl isomerase [Cohnella sp. LGH]|uniref:peptidylprolyl isomerase n=1 Tax=Cohnella sp. LGH TaxID=1619153 RepID=UPI001ADCB0BB|nr:peptidylprolyl isomerase [Cohnella sp. LGH]QTH44753.1 peptidylprolyl isomerase [Cohnella sp. LGH]